LGVVDDGGLEGVAGGEVADGCAQLADFVNAAVGGGVNREHVDGGAGGDFAAGRALAAGLHRRTFLAVQRFRQDARRGGLAHAARAGEDVGVGDLVLLEGVLQRADDGFLADDFVEGLRAVLARDYLVGHRRGCGPVVPSDSYPSPGPPPSPRGGGGGGGVAVP